MARTIVLTGASDGIGAAAARALSRKGHHVVIVGRSRAKTEAVGRQIGADVFVADFASLDDVRRLAADLDAALPRIDVLANNAGAILGEHAKTADGFEETFQVNHLSPFLLTHLLIPKLVESRAAIIQTSSLGARHYGRIDLSDVQHDSDYTPLLAYGTAKLANILFTNELHRRFHAAGISAAAFHPGVIASSFGSQAKGLFKHLATSRLVRAFLPKPEKGAGQLIWLAEGQPGHDWHSGTYYENYRPARRNNPQALDGELARQLWKRSEQLLNLQRN